ncbi:MAG: HD domain-containing protein, partial [Muribaculaceae bacterium]|nr:HD domain-containing protein [Muribaculaceae bacterium]
MEQEQIKYFTDEERRELLTEYRRLMASVVSVSEPGDEKRVRKVMTEAVTSGAVKPGRFGLNPTLHSMITARTLCEKVSPDRSMVLAILLFGIYRHTDTTDEEITSLWGEDIARLIYGLRKVMQLYAKQPAVESDNFRNLLLTFAQDIRVIIIMLVDRLCLMRAINHHPNEKLVRDVAYEANYLYAPLAHRLGLYVIKSELEDMSLKYTNRDTYTRIARKLNETKVSRDAYIADFIKPVTEKLEAAGLKFDIKGRTKSIYSIWNKIQKQHNDLEHIYDLFAIRIIIDAPMEKEKSDCWLAYSIVTDMYKPNPSRMKDWLSIPKSNGYESLHITVSGPGGKWVEVQIRTRRMDLIAEKGLAAHWRYKGLKGDNSLDVWMNNVRDILETADSGPMELMKNVR